MNICTNCGREAPDTTKFCTYCGNPAKPMTFTPVETSNVTAEQSVNEPTPATFTYTHNEYTQPGKKPEPVPAYQVKPALDPSLEPITTAGYFGIFLLLMIPVIGWIFTIVWAFGGCKKVNKRNMARAVVLMWVVSFLFAAIIIFLLSILFQTIFTEFNLPYFYDSFYFPFFFR